MGYSTAKKQEMENRLMRVATAAKEMGHEFDCQMMAKHLNEPMEIVRGAINALIGRKLLTILGRHYRNEDRVTSSVYIYTGLKPSLGLISSPSKRKMPVHEHPGTWNAEKVSKHHTIYRAGRDLKLGKGQSTGSITRGFSHISLLD